jgi:hypothetical protein
MTSSDRRPLSGREKIHQLLLSLVVVIAAIIVLALLGWRVGLALVAVAALVFAVRRMVAQK